MYLLKVFAKSILAVFAFIFSSILLIIHVFTVPLIFVLFATYRFVIKCVAKCKLPGSVILNPVDGSFSFDDVYKNTNSYVIVKLVMEGTVTVDTIRDQWMRKIITKKRPNGHLKYARLQQCLISFGGYLFRKSDKHFDIKSYIKEYKGENPGDTIDKLKLTQIQQDFKSKVFKKGTSPWEMLIVNNYCHKTLVGGKECTVLLYKFHHNIGDGFSTFKLFFSEIAGVKIDGNQTKKQLSRLTMLSRTIQRWASVMRYFHNLAFHFIYNRKRFLDRHPWHSSSNLSGEWEFWMTEPIPKKSFREIKQGLKVSGNSILTACILGGMRRMMLSKLLKVPKKINIQYPVPRSNHPDYLVNHLTCLEVRVPFGNLDHQERLLETDKVMKRGPLGPGYIVSKVYGPMLGHIPNWITSRIFYYVGCSVVIPSSPMPSTTNVQFFGSKAVYWDTTVYIKRFNLGMLVTTLGDADNFYLTLQIDKGLLESPDEIKNLEKYILEELDAYLKVSQV